MRKGLGIVIVVIGCVLLLFLCIFLSKRTQVPSWVEELGLRNDEVCDLTFMGEGDNVCPQVPITINEKEYPFIFDTGNSIGFSVTNALENKIRYREIRKIEALNRDGSHRGWSSEIEIDEITIFQEQYDKVKATMNEWSMISSQEFNGLIGLAYFPSKVIVLDYENKKMAVSNKKINYDNLSNSYITCKIINCLDKGMEDLIFFEAEYKGKPICIYLDTGKNHSYIWNENGDFSWRDRPSVLSDAVIKIGEKEISLTDLVEVNDIAQGEGLPYPTVIELNSDQIVKNNILVILDLMEHKITFKIK